MEFLCKQCDRLSIENHSEYMKYLATMRKENHKSLYKKYTINNINLDEVEKNLNDYVTFLNKKLNFYFINFEFVIEFDNNFTTNRETIYVHNVESNKIKKYLLYYIDCFTAGGYNVCYIKQKTIKTISDRCNMTCGDLKHSMHAVGRKMDMKIAKNLQMVN